MHSKGTVQQRHNNPHQSLRQCQNKKNKNVRKRLVKEKYSNNTKQQNSTVEMQTYVNCKLSVEISKVLAHATCNMIPLANGKVKGLGYS